MVGWRIDSGEEDLEEVLEWEERGWVGEGRGRVCLNRTGALEEGREYMFSIRGESMLYEVEGSANFSFFVHRSSSLSSPSSSLWDPSPFSLYGIVLSPYLPRLLPPSLRSLPLLLTTHALSSSSFQTSKDILPFASFDWEFLDPVPEGLANVDPNDWSNGTTMVIPSSTLQQRTAFPIGETVKVRVIVDFGNDIVFSDEVEVGFAPSPIEMVVNFEGGENEKEGGHGYVFTGEGGELEIDFSNSFTNDGINFEEGGGEWVWEWEWDCVIPGSGRGGEGGVCVYEGGKKVEMPGIGEWRFEGEEGERFEEGVPLFFIVNARVRERGGGVLAEGRWSGMVNVVAEGGGGVLFALDQWICEDSSIGFVVSYFYFYSSWPFLVSHTVFR